jgi:hypothetical protein
MLVLLGHRLTALLEALAVEVHSPRKLGVLVPQVKDMLVGEEVGMVLAGAEQAPLALVDQVQVLMAQLVAQV